jgi:hypothetical protein
MAGSEAPPLLVWTGIDSPTISLVESGFSATPGDLIVAVDNGALVQIEVNDATSIRINNTSNHEATGVITLTW